MIPKSAISELTRIVGTKNVITQKQDLIPYSHDRTQSECMPDLAVIPRDAVQISRILQIANRERFPVTPRGAGSGMSGAPLPYGVGWFWR